jgi:hypothetical protein
MDLLQEAEGYCLELKTRNIWSKRADNSRNFNESNEKDADLNGGEEEIEELPCNNKAISTPSAKIPAVLKDQLKKVKKEMKDIALSQKHKWKYIAPKEGKPTEKQVYQCGKIRKFYWCEYHKQWTRHKPSECMLLKIETKRQRRAQQGDYQKKKQVYKKAKAQMQSLDMSSDSEENTDQDQVFEDSDSDSNISGSTVYFSDEYDSNVS